MIEHEEEIDLSKSEENKQCNEATTDDFNKFLEKRIEAIQDN